MPSEIRKFQKHFPADETSNLFHTETKSNFSDHTISNRSDQLSTEEPLKTHFGNFLQLLRTKSLFYLLAKCGMHVIRFDSSICFFVQFRLLTRRTLCATKVLFKTQKYLLAEIVSNRTAVFAANSWAQSYGSCLTAVPWCPICSLTRADSSSTMYSTHVFCKSGCVPQPLFARPLACSARVGAGQANLHSKYISLAWQKKLFHLDSSVQGRTVTTAEIIRPPLPQGKFPAVHCHLSLAHIHTSHFDTAGLRRSKTDGGSANTSAPFPTCPNCQIGDIDIIN